MKTVSEPLCHKGHNSVLSLHQHHYTWLTTVLSSVSYVAGWAKAWVIFLKKWDSKYNNS